jgi:hypothetical protein
VDADLLGELPLVEPRVPELTNELIDLGLVAAPARALDVMHPSPSPGSKQIGNHGVHRTLTFYSLSSQIQQERTTYYDVLERSQKGSLDVTEWIDWFLGCLQRAIQSSEVTLQAVLTQARFWESHAGKPFNGRQRLLLNRLLDGFEGKLTSTKWPIIAKCSQDTALRDIGDLMERGILTRQEAGGRSTHSELVLPRP